MLVDYSTSHPTITQLKRAGVTGVGRYIGWDSVPGYSSIGKNITRSEAQSLLGAGFEVFLAFEYAADAASHGTAQGRSDGNLAMTQLGQLGAPPNMAVYFCLDYDIPDYAPHLSDTAGNARAKLGPIGDYFAAIKALKNPYQIGVYGGYYAVKRVMDAGLATRGWQTVAWSGGKTDSRPDIYQTAGKAPIAGADVDIRQHVANADYGQWSNRPTAPTTPEKPKTEEDYEMAYVLDYLVQDQAVCIPVPAGKTKVTFYCDSGYGGLHVAPSLRVGFAPSWHSSTVNPTWDVPADLALGNATRLTIGRVDKGNSPVTVDFS